MYSTARKIVIDVYASVCMLEQIMGPVRTNESGPTKDQSRAKRQHFFHHIPICRRARTDTAALDKQRLHATKPCAASLSIATSTVSAACCDSSHVTNSSIPSFNRVFG